MIVPPVTLGAFHVSDTWPFPAVALRPVGEPGRPVGVAEVIDEYVPVPNELTAATRNRYVTPGVKENNWIEVE